MRRDERGHARATRVIAGVTAVAVLSGCSGMGNETLTRVQGGLLGAASGAALGGLAGGGRGAVIGMIAGLVAGLAVAEFVNFERRDYASNADRISGEQRIAADNLRSTSAYNEKLRGRINELQAQERALAQQRASGVNDQAQLVALRNDVIRQRDEAGKNLQMVEQALAEQRRQLQLATEAAGRGSAELADLQQKVRQMEQERDALRASLDRLEASARRL